MSTPRPPSEGPLLPVAALVLSVVGLCLPPLLLISGGLGLYGYLRARREPLWAPRKQVAQMTMAVSGAGLLIFLGLGLPNFKRVQLRIKQRECSEVLTSVYEAEQRFYAKQKRYTTKLAELDLVPSRGRQLVRLAGEGPLWTSGLLADDQVGQGFDETKYPTLSTRAVDESVPQLVRGEVGLKGECPACSVTILCASNVDADPAPDVWTVSTIERLGGNGERIPGGFPWNETDDVNE